jgi:hypothetical protein
MDIGYGECDPYPHEWARTLRLCICSTDYCSDTWATCEASVNQARGSPPPLLPTYLPSTWGGALQCGDSSSYYYDTSGTLQFYRLACSQVPYSGWGYVNIYNCSTLASNISHVCAFMSIRNGHDGMMAMFEGSYEVWLWAIVEGFFSSLGFTTFQSSTRVVVVEGENSSAPYYDFYCFCITNDCNRDPATCTAGMNIPSHLLTQNRSTSETGGTGRATLRI